MMEHMLPGIGDAKRIAVDTETTGLRPYGGDVLRGISLAWEVDGTLRSVYWPVSHPDLFSNLPVEPIIALLNFRHAAAMTPLQRWFADPIVNTELVDLNRRFAELM